MGWPIPAHFDPPPLLPEHIPIWQAFWEINRSRPGQWILVDVPGSRGQQQQWKLQLAPIPSWVILLWVEREAGSREDAAFWRRCIYEMDDAYLKLQSEGVAQRQIAAEPMSLEKFDELFG